MHSNQAIKIYGEAKTGTTYLEKLLRQNCDRPVLECSAWGELGWKHGFPQPGEALYIFIFRDVYETVKSLLADDVDRRFQGIDATYESPTGRDFNNHHVWANFFECRRAKYYAYIGFARLHDAVLLNYDYLRTNPDCLSPLTGGPVEDIPTHTYKDIPGRDNPERRPLTNAERQVVDEHIDHRLEAFVDGLEAWYVQPFSHRE